jgi:hypothetical protein
MGTSAISGGDAVRQDFGDELGGAFGSLLRDRRRLETPVARSVISRSVTMLEGPGRIFLAGGRS